MLFTLSALFLLPRRTSLRELPTLYLWVGALLFVAYEVCFVLALGLARSRNEAIEVGMVNYLWPSLTVLMSAMAGRQRLNALMLGGLALALAGVVGASSPPEGLSPMDWNATVALLSTPLSARFWGGAALVALGSLAAGIGARRPVKR